jgi:hypothetical protein
MDPNIKLILDKIEKLGDRFTSLESRIDNLSGRFSGVECRTTEVTVWRSEVDSSVADLVTKIDAVGDLADKVEAAGDLIVKASSIDALKWRVSTLASRMDRVVLNHGGSALGILPKPETAAATPSADNPTVGPDGHRTDNHHRENGFGSVMAYTSLPVKGASSDPYTSFSRPLRSHRFSSSTGSSMSNSSGHWPKFPLPKFEGENPKLWQSRCENYFDMCGVDKSNWVRISSMYFDGSAARWL